MADSAPLPPDVAALVAAATPRVSRPPDPPAPGPVPTVTPPPRQRPHTDQELLDAAAAAQDVQYAELLRRFVSRRRSLSPQGASCHSHAAESCS